MLQLPQVPVRLEDPWTPSTVRVPFRLEDDSLQERGERDDGKNSREMTQDGPDRAASAARQRQASARGGPGACVPVFRFQLRVRISAYARGRCDGGKLK